MRRSGTVVTLGGGGFSMPDVAGDHGPLLDNYLLALTGVPRPRVCFIGTATGDADEDTPATRGADPRFLATQLEEP